MAPSIAFTIRRFPAAVLRRSNNRIAPLEAEAGEKRVKCIVGTCVISAGSSEFAQQKVNFFSAPGDGGHGPIKRSNFAVRRSEIADLWTHLVPDWRRGF